MSYLWLKESHKHYTAFNHANLDHSLLTAWCLFKVIMLNRLLHKIISRLVKEGKHNLNYNSTCSLLWNYFSSCNCKILAISSVFRIPVLTPSVLTLKQKHKSISTAGSLRSAERKNKHTVNTVVLHDFCDINGPSLKYSPLSVSKSLEKCVCFPWLVWSLGPVFSAWVYVLASERLMSPLQLY